MARIYTRSGDAGETSLLDGTRVEKRHGRVAAAGDVDELNALVGQARSALDGTAGDLDGVLESIQRDLFALGALLADPRRDAEQEGGSAQDDRLDFREARVSALEKRMDAWEEELPPLRVFILPAGTPAGSSLHVARAAARRAERTVVSLASAGEGNPRALRYLNRLSDLLFVAARVANSRAGHEDEPWS